MKRLITLVTLVAAAVAGRGYAAVRHGDRVTAASSTVDTVLINPGRIKHTIPSGFFGINYVGFWDDAAGSRASATALSQTAIKAVRFPGGAPADWYDWQNPYYKGWSHTSPIKVWRYARSLGGNRVLFGTNVQGHQPNPPGKSYAVNSPQNAAAWAAYDKKMGIRADMEVGNEEDIGLLHKTDDPAYAAYAARFNAQAKAMHRVNPRVRVLGPVGTNEYYWWGLDGLGTFLKATGNRAGSGQVDGISLHFYRGNGWLDTRGVAQYWTSPDGPWAAIQRIIRAHDTRQLPVYVTEWNVGGADQNSAFEPTLGHALANADLIGGFAASGVAAEYYFDTHGAHTWGLLYGKGEDRPVDSPTPTYYAMALWRHMGNRILDMQQSDDAASVMSAYATTRSDGSVQVLAINKQPSSRRLRVELQGASPAGHRVRAYTLQGITHSVDDHDVRYDGVRMPSPARRLPGPRDAGIVHGRTVIYSVPGYSAVVLDLSGTSRDTELQWDAVPTSSPAPPVSFTVQARVEHPVVKLGEAQPLSATVASTQDVGSVLVDLEVYDSASAKVYQQTKTVDLGAAKPATVLGSYSVSPTARTGTYHLKVGVFGPSWSPMYAWKDDAGSFKVADS